MGINTADIDRRFMIEAISMARKGFGKTSPNPAVGAVLVRDLKIIGKGYHLGYGLAHAEIEALGDARRNGCDLTGATLYVTLEPCNHFGKTAPCTEAIIAARIARVVYGTIDPNPKVSGKGISVLSGAGISCHPSAIPGACAAINPGFFKVHRENRAYVALKVAQTLDGLIATHSGESRYITGEAARKDVHRLRNWYDAVLVGAGTIALDDPSLTVRSVKGRTPKRIVLSGNLSLPVTAKIFNDADRKNTLVITRSTDLSRRKSLSDKGIEVIDAELQGDGTIDIGKILANLPRRGILSILVEGGAKTFSCFLEQELVDRLYCYVNPRILGNGLSSFSGLPSIHLHDCFRFESCAIKKFGDDYRFILDKPFRP